MRIRFFSFGMLCLAGACATRSAAKASGSSLTSESHELQMGRTVDSCLIATRRFYNDSAWERYVQQIGVRLAAKSERPGLPWTFRVLDDPVVNAFALPGGIVYVTRGLLAYLNSEAQLAAVLGHEIGHVAARHVGGESERREMERLGLVVGTAAGSVTAVYGDVEGTDALLLANSRYAEQEADDLGLHYMSDAGYDPTEMVAALRMLAALRAVERAAGDSPLPEWLSTHPTPERRIESVTLEQFSLRSAGTRVERDPYLARVDGLTFGLDRRQGYFKKNRYVVPAGGYQVTFPAGWNYKSYGAAARGVSQEKDAVFELTTTDQPNADSAARFFFAKLASPRGSPTPEQVNGLTVVSASFSWLPFWVKVRGSVRFIECRGTVYRVMGYTRNSGWSANREVIESALQSLEAVPDSEMRQAQPLRVTTVSLQQPMSLTALIKARSAPVGPTDLAGINQVPIDSVLPAGQIVKWVVDTPSH